MRKIFVTGGAGFIGSAFVHLILSETENVEIIDFDALTYAGNLENLAGIDERRHQFIKGDICDREAVLAALPEETDAVINFAAESHVDRSIASANEFVVTNVLGTQVLLDAARAKFSICRLESRCRAFRPRRASHFWSRYGDNALRQQLRAAPIPGKTDSADDRQRAER